MPQGTEIVLAEEGEERSKLLPRHIPCLYARTGRRGGDLSSFPLDGCPCPRAGKTYQHTAETPNPCWRGRRTVDLVQSRPTPRDPDGRPLHSGCGFWATTKGREEGPLRRDPV